MKTINSSIYYWKYNSILIMIYIDKIKKLFIYLDIVSK